MIINLQLNRQVLPLFVFLKDNPTRTLAKGNHVVMTYFLPFGMDLTTFSYKGITVSVTDTDDLESYLANNWIIARDYQIASVGDKLGGILDELEHEYLNKHRTGCPLPIQGLVFDWIAYGITDHESVTKFVKVFYLAGYSYEQITLLYASLTKNSKLNICFLDEINKIFKGELDERIFRRA